MLDRGSKIIIIGGGIIGCSTAYYLTKSGYCNVSVVEAVSVAHAASGRAGGFLAKDWCDHGPTKQLARRSFDLHKELAKELGADTIGYRQLRTLSLTADGGKKSRSRSSKADLPAWINGAEVGQGEVIGQHETTAQVHPAQLTRALMEAVRRAGGRLVNTKVTGANYTGRKVHSVKLESGDTLSGDVFVLCMGPWTSAGLGWFKKAPVISGKRAHSVTIKVEPGSIDDTALFLQYNDDYAGKSFEPEIYPRPDGSVYVCGSGRDEAPLPPDPAHVTTNPDSCSQLVELAGRVSDRLAASPSLAVTNSACYLPYTEDNIPLVGSIPGLDRLYMAAGHFCWGILQGPATGEALAQQIITGQSADLLKPFDPSRLIR